MRTREEVIEKIKEYYKLEPESKTNLRNIGFVDALRWVIEKESEGE